MSLAFEGMPPVVTPLAIHSGALTLHQKVRVPGPVTEVCIHDSWLLAMGPLQAASRPSRVVLVWNSQGAEPPRLHASVQASTASQKVQPTAREMSCVVA